MKLMNDYRLWTISLVFTSLLLACAALESTPLEEKAAYEVLASQQERPLNPGEVDSQSRTASDRYHEIQALAAESRQCDRDDDCALLGLGARPCGGPDEYLVYSKASSNKEALLDLVQYYNRKAKLINDKEGRVGICMVEPKPKTRCVQKQCITTANFNNTVQ